MNKSFYISIIIFCIVVTSSFRMCIQAGRKHVYNELSETQRKILRLKKAEKEELQKQTVIAEDRIRAFLADRAHEDLVRIEMAEKARRKK